MTADTVEPVDLAEPTEPRSHLAGLISRVLESADQLAASTRRTRRAHTPAPTDPSPPDPSE